MSVPCLQLVEKKKISNYNLHYGAHFGEFYSLVVIILKVRFSNFSTSSFMFAGGTLTSLNHNPKHNSPWCVHLCTQLTGKAERVLGVSLQL